MAVYFFETITAAEAAAYNAATDTLVFSDEVPEFHSPGVIFNANGTVTLYQVYANSQPSVTFAAGFQGETGIVTPDHKRVLIGTTGADAIGGTSGTDYIYGGPGADTLAGGAAGDVLYGGAGADLFAVRAGDAAVGGATFEVIVDWSAEDRLAFAGPTPTGTNATELIGVSTYDQALTAANAIIAQGAFDFVYTRFGSYVWVFADSRGDNGGADDVVLIQSSSSPFSSANLTTLPVALPGPPPALPVTATHPGGSTGGAPPAVPQMPGSPALGLPAASGIIGGNMDLVHIGDLGQAIISEADETHIRAATTGMSLLLRGAFAYNANFDLVGGTVNWITFSLQNGAYSTDIYTPGVSIGLLSSWLLDDASQTAYATLFTAGDHLQGTFRSDLVRGYGGNDHLEGEGGDDSLFGGLGDDVIYAYEHVVGATFNGLGSTYLRGEEGNDYIVGGGGFDDINGNMGNDTGSGGAGADWVVGGKDDDLLFGDAGDDIVYGNLGDDRCVGGAGDDLIRGGQGDDLLWGGDGNDWLSGDRGDDTMVGGAGADIFHTFGDAGIDRVLDFSVAEGDRVQLDPGTQYTAAQVGADVVISMTGGGQMILVGVQLSSLPNGWIFGA